MASIYLRLTDGSDADNGSTWALAKATLAGVAAIDAAGDTVFVADGHSEATASALTLAFAGTISGGPVRVLCVDDTADPEPPTTLATGALIATTGNNTITINGSAYFYGLHFRSGNSTGVAHLIAHGTNDLHTQVFESCTMEVGTTGSTSNIGCGSSGGDCNRTEFIGCSFKFGHTGQKIALNGSGTVKILGGSIVSGSAAITTMFYANTNIPNTVYVEGFDASNAAAGLNIVTTSGGQSGEITLRDCTLPSGWSGSPSDNPLTGGGNRVRLIGCKAGSTPVRYWSRDAFGDVRDVTTVYTTAGQYDGVARWAYKFSSTAYANNHAGRLYGPEMVAFVGASGAHTVAVDICHDGASALKDTEVWLEVLCDGAWVRDAASVLSSGSAQASSATDWTGDSGTGPNGSSTWHTLQLSVSISPAAAGPVMARVVLGKATTTVYVDPNLAVTV